MTTIPLSTIGSPKKRLVEMALGKCGILEYTPEEAAFVLNELDALMLTWPFSGLGYVQPDYGTGSLEELSGTDPQWDLAVSLALAEAIAPLMANAQPLAPSALAAKARQISLLGAAVATTPTGIIVSSPAGAGNRRLGRSAFIHET
jgi:hypothetical protein